MQIGQAQVVRSNWYDRSLTLETQAFVSSTAPHVSNVRNTYTVPANRVARISVMSTSIVRITAATGSGVVDIRYTLTPNGAGEIQLSSLRFQDNNLYVLRRGNNIPAFIMSAGDKIELVTSDNSTGGAVFFNGGFNINEYDA